LQQKAHPVTRVGLVLNGIMAEKKSLAGQRFGRLTVLDNYIERINTKGKKEYKWLCRCDCGTERYIPQRSLLYGRAESCGCLQRERTQNNRAHDLSGQVFGDLTVLEKVEKRSPGGAIQWRCQCSCGAEYVVAGTLLTTGRRTHCPDKSAHRAQLRYKTSDITGQKFGRLTALSPSDKRSGKKSVLWHCRCDCGREVDVAYNELLYTTVKSCGCQKKENDQNLKNRLTHVAGTSLDMIKSQKLPTDNTTGYRGVYFIHGKYTAKIVFQKKQYYLGTFSTADEAAEARKAAEILLFDGTADYYHRWQKRAEEDPEWAGANPVSIHVGRDSAGELKVTYDPLI